MFIKKEINDQICIITIDRQDALNAMNPDILRELDQTIKGCISDQSIGVIIITGAGEKAFIAGADIKVMQNLDSKGGLGIWKTGTGSNHDHRGFTEACTRGSKWIRLRWWL